MEQLTPEEEAMYAYMEQQQPDLTDELYGLSPEEEQEWLQQQELPPAEEKKIRQQMEPKTNQPAKQPERKKIGLKSDAPVFVPPVKVPVKSPIKVPVKSPIKVPVKSPIKVTDVQAFRPTGKIPIRENVVQNLLEYKMSQHESRTGIYDPISKEWIPSGECKFPVELLKFDYQPTQEELNRVEQLYTQKFKQWGDYVNTSYNRWVDLGNKPENFNPPPLGILGEQLKEYNECVKNVRKRTRKQPGYIPRARKDIIDNLVDHLMSIDESRKLPNGEYYKPVSVQKFDDGPTQDDWDLAEQKFAAMKEKHAADQARRRDEWPDELDDFILWPIGLSPEEYNDFKKEVNKQKKAEKQLSHQERVRKWEANQDEQQRKHEQKHGPHSYIRQNPFEQDKDYTIRRNKALQDRKPEDDCVNRLLRYNFSKDPRWHNQLYVPEPKCEVTDRIKVRVEWGIQKEKENNEKLNEKLLAKHLEKGGKEKDYIPIPLGLPSSEIPDFIKDIKDKLTEDKRKIHEAEEDKRQQEHEKKYGKGTYLRRYFREPNKDYKERVAKFLDEEIDTKDDGTCNFERIMCGPFDVKTNENYKDEFDTILEKERDLEWYNKFIGIDKNEFEKIITSTRQDPRITKLINEFLNKYFKGNEKYWYSIVKRYDQLMWSTKTPVMTYRPNEDELSLIKNESPVQVITNHVTRNDLYENIAMIRSQTGSGKSVLIPLIVFNARWNTELRKYRGKRKKHDPTQCTFGKIICTQPRVLNAKNISNFVAGMTCTEPGHVVGFDVGGERNTNKNTMIIYQTIGKLIQDLKETIINKDFKRIKKRYDTIIIDEVHDRSVDQDLLLGFLLEIPKEHRPRIILMSATIDESTFSLYLDQNETDYTFYQLGDYPETDDECNVRGIDCKYLPKDSDDYQTDIIKRIMEINQKDTNANMGILVFLPGQGEISNLQSKLKLPENKYWVRVLTRENLSHFEKDNKLNDRNDKKQIILATNVAETGITIPKIGYVIDSGMQKISVYDPQTDSNILMSTCISQDNAIQRRGRIGRIPGPKYKFYTIYTEETWLELEKSYKFSLPQIYLSELTSTILMLKNVYPDRSIFDFRWVDRPTNEVVSCGLHKLFHLGAIDTNGNMTKLGEKLNDPGLSRLSMEGRKALITASKKGVKREVAIILVMESAAQGLKLGNYCTPLLFPNVKSDHITLLYIYETFLEQVKKIKDTDKLKKWCVTNCLNYDTLDSVKDTLDELLKLTFDDEPPKSKNPESRAALGGRISEEDSKHIKILQCLFSGYFMQTGELPNQGSKMYHLDTVNVYAKIDNSSSFVFSNSEMSHAIYPKHIMYSGLRMTKSLSTGIAQYKMSLVSEINPNWFSTGAPDYRLIA